MSTFVKICGLTDEAAIRAAIDAGTDAVGFVFQERSPRNISVELAKYLAEDLPASVLRVAVTMHPDRALWNLIQATLRPDVVQTDIEDLRYLEVDAAIEQWPVIREGSVPNSVPERFVYEGPKSGQGETVDWNIAAGYSRRGRMILAGGLNSQNVVEAIRTVRPFGVDVSSAVESVPGRKDPAKIKTFVEAAKAA